jgi:hypothetical protein
MARLLSARGVTAHPTTIAKIETGERVVRIEELSALADMLDLSVDTLIGHKRRPGGDLAYAQRALRDTVEHTARVVTEQLVRIGSATVDLDIADHDSQCAELRASTDDLVHALLNAKELAERFNNRGSTVVWIEE